MLNQIRILLLAVASMLVTSVNLAFTKSQRETLTYADPSGQGVNHPLADKTAIFSLQQIFTVYGDYSLEGGDPADPTAFVFPSGDGMYRVYFPTIELNTEIGVLSTGCYANIKVVNGLPIAAGSWLETISKADNNSIFATIAGLLAQLQSQLETYASNAATNAKNAAITDTNSKVVIVRGQAATDATNKVNTAIQFLESYANNAADNRKTLAIAASNGYTDAEIAKLQSLPQQGFEPRFVTLDTTEANDGTVTADGGVTITNLKKGQFYAVNVTGLNVGGDVISDKEFKLEVVTGLKSNGTDDTILINASTNDKLIYECVAKANGDLYAKFIQIHQDYLMETVLNLQAQIGNQLSEVEANDLLIEVQAMIDTSINAALK